MGLVESFNDLNNTLSGISDGVGKFWEGVKYWGNPINLFTEAHLALAKLVHAEATAEILIGGTIVSIWLIMCNVTWVKKWVFWSWVVYWVLRGFIYRDVVFQ